MARRCELTGKATQTGHLVSHSNHKTKTVFRPNLVNVTLQSDALGRGRVRLRVLELHDVVGSDRPRGRGHGREDLDRDHQASGVGHPLSIREHPAGSAHL